MRFEVLVVFLLKAAFSTAYEPEREESYQDERSDMLEDQTRPQRRSGALTTASDGALRSGDGDIVKGAMQQLLSEKASDDVDATPPPIDTLNATSTTLVVRQQLLDASNETTMAATSSYTKPASTVIDYVDEDAEEETTMASEITSSLYAKLSAGLIDYVGEEQTTKLPPPRTTTAQWRPPPTDARAAPRRTANTLRVRRPTSRPTTTTSTTTGTTDSESTTQDDEEYYEIEIVRAGTIDNTTDAMDSDSIEQYDEQIISRAAGKVISKCYVCGLEAEGIPGDAPCADAFAADLLPLTAVDPTARRHLPDFRKYCRLSPKGGGRAGADGRSVLGAWTGGCSVRWIDLSGVYTQRACRSRETPVMGRHYVSKRMAKLEKALRKVDSGCIASPAATLVPFSRSVSLYARVHVCVCAENWCNRAARPRTAHLTWLLPALAYSYVAHT